MYFRNFDPIPSELDDLVYSTANHEILGRFFLKALTLMKQLDHRSALFLRIQSTIFQNLAKTVTELHYEQRNYTNTIEFVREIIKLSPISDEFYPFYVNFLSEVSLYATEYRQMVEECKQALGIGNRNVDLDMGNVGVGMEMYGLTPIRTVTEDVHTELKELLQKSDAESVLLFMRNLGNGAEDFRLKGTGVSYRRVTKEPKEIESQAVSEMEIKKITKKDQELNKEIEVHTEKEIEMKKTTKTDEEQKKEIEDQAKREIKIKKTTKMAEEQKKESEVKAEREVKSKNATKNDEEQKKEIENKIEKATKLAEEQKKESEVENRKVSETKNATKTDEELKNTTKTGEVQNKQNKEVKADQVKQESSAKSVRKQESAAERQKQEAMNKKKDWATSLWNSMSIEEKKDILKIKISDLNTHFRNSHMIKIIQEALSWYDTNKSWKYWDCCKCDEKFVDKRSYRFHLVPQHFDSLRPKMNSIMPMGVDKRWSELLLNCPWEPLDASATAKILTDKKKCKDSELVEDTPPQKNSVCDQIFKDAWDSSLQKHGFGNSSNKCDIFENVTRSGFNQSQDSVLSYVVSDDPVRKELLKKIQAVFELLVRHKYLGENSLLNIIKFTIEELQGLPIGSHILSEGLDQTPLCICFLGYAMLMKILKVLKEISLSCGIGIYSDKNKDEQAVKKDEQVKEIESMFIYEDASIILGDYFLKPVDVFLQWIYISGEKFATLSHIDEERNKQNTEIFQTLQEEYCHMQSFYERKCDYMNYEEAVKSVQDLCLEESKKRKACNELVLRERREELIKAESVTMFIGSRFELDAITNVLKEVEAQPCDDVDTFINNAILEQQKHLSDEISKIDARILRSVSVIEQLELKLETVSSHEYESILITLASVYLREHLEDLAEKDAMKKSEAVLKALLDEEEQNKKKGGSEKPKGKKKGKTSKKAKGSKGIKLQNESEVVSNVEHLKPSADQLAEEDLVFETIGNILAKINDSPGAH